MKHTLLALLLAASLLPASAFAKGPSGASIDGGGGITFGGDEASGPLGALTEQAGFFPAVFGQEAGPMLTGRPKAELGPKYTITYTVPGPSNEVWRLRQEVYPYAMPAPVTYMKPGQDVYNEQTRGGWFQADASLKQTLVEAGLPSTAAGASSESSGFPTALVTASTTALLVAMAAALFIRRRTRPATA
jgi:hypothetical protein